jgi:hypothetical protein
MGRQGMRPRWLAGLAALCAMLHLSMAQDPAGAVHGGDDSEHRPPPCENGPYEITLGSFEKPQTLDDVLAEVLAQESFCWTAVRFASPGRYRLQGQYTLTQTSLTLDGSAAGGPVVIESAQPGIALTVEGNEVFLEAKDILFEVRPLTKKSTRVCPTPS